MPGSKPVALLFNALPIFQLSPIPYSVRFRCSFSKTFFRKNISKFHNSPEIKSSEFDQKAITM